ncbi:MAG: hypothetical protein KAY32_01995 [Candidatus Eisenbacteria sp.]|nr:hypothetical protein [Candidatus Eisenbacteria bacterium]
MIRQAALRDRFMRDGIGLRLGGLAANLARVASFCSNPDHKHVAASWSQEVIRLAGLIAEA